MVARIIDVRHALGETDETPFHGSARDEWLTAEQFRADLNALAARPGRVRACEFDGGHEWNAAVAEAAGEFLLSA